MKTLARRIFTRLPWHLRRTVRSAIRDWAYRRPAFESTIRSSFDQFPNRMATIDREQAEAAELGVRLAIAGDIEGGVPLHRYQRNHDLLPICLAMLKRELRRPVSILDFGGAAGIDYAYLQHGLGRDTELRYTVVEFAPVCEVGRRVWSGHEGITFVDDLSKAEELYDIVYAWSSVQYIPDAVGMLRRLARRSRRAVLIVGTCFGTESFVRAQVNQSVSYPQWVLSLPETEATLAAEGFRLAFRAAGADDYNVDNFDPRYRVGRSACLLFLRDGDLDRPATA